MREKKQKNGQGQNRYSWQHLKEDLGAVGGLLVFLTIVLGAAVLPGLISDSASTVTPRLVRAAHR
jgi:hypothetical protein